MDLLIYASILDIKQWTDGRSVFLCLKIHMYNSFRNYKGKSEKRLWSVIVTMFSHLIVMLYSKLINITEYYLCLKSLNP